MTYWGDQFCTSLICMFARLSLAEHIYAFKKGMVTENVCCLSFICGVSLT